MLKDTIRIYNGATAIITGGASGIGAALGRELAQRGCEVVLADRQIELAEEVAAAIRSGGGKASAAELNVVNYAAVEALVYETVSRTGRLDYMFNNAGIAMSGPAAVYSINDWNDVLDVNLRGVINGVQAAYKLMREQGFGHIVNTASFAGLVACPGSLSYATTKHAIVGLSKTLRIEAALAGIQVSVLCPGFVRTPIIDRCGKYGKVLQEPSPELQQFVEKFKPLAPEVFAQKALAAVSKNEGIIVIPGRNKLFWLFDRLFPEWNSRLMQKKVAEFFR